MNKMTILATMTATLLASTTAWAQPETVITQPVVTATAEAQPTVVTTVAPPVVSVEVVRELNTPAVKATPEKVPCADAATCINEVYNDFMAKNKWPTSGTDAKGKTYFFGNAPVQFAKSHSAYGKALSLAYTEAYMQAIDKFSRSMILDVQNELVYNAFADASTDRLEFPQPQNGYGRSEVEALWLKINKYAQARLDKGLKELGIDPSQYSAMPPDEQKKLLENALSNKTVERTSLALGGINVVGNFVHEAADGTAHVGLVIAYSPNIEGVAQSLRMGQKPAIQAVGQPLLEQIPSDPVALKDMYGPRLMIDDQGPVIVSFAFWSPEAGSPKFQSRLREAAMRQAESEASSQIARFLTLSYSGKLETEKGNISGVNAVKSGKDGSITQRTVDVIRDITSSQNIARTSATLTGLTTIRQWQWKTPEGHELVGVVKAYSFGNIEAAKRMTTKDAPAAKSAQPSTNNDVTYQADTRQGTIQSAIDVF